MVLEASLRTVGMVLASLRMVGNDIRSILKDGRYGIRSILKVGRYGIRSILKGGSMVLEASLKTVGMVLGAFLRTVGMLLEASLRAVCMVLEASLRTVCMVLEASFSLSRLEKVHYTQSHYIMTCRIWFRAALIWLVMEFCLSLC